METPSSGAIVERVVSYRVKSRKSRTRVGELRNMITERWDARKALGWRQMDLA
jgi:hypothetical protein